MAGSVETPTTRTRSLAYLRIVRQTDPTKRLLRSGLFGEEDRERRAHEIQQFEEATHFLSKFYWTVPFYSNFEYVVMLAKTTDRDCIP